MSTLLAIEKTILSFQAVHERLGLCRATDESFFVEWQVQPIEIPNDDRTFLVFGYVFYKFSLIFAFNLKIA